MRYQLYYTPTFKKRLRKFLKKHPELELDIQSKIDLLAEDPFHPSLRTHKVFGDWAAWVTWEYRLIFEITTAKVTFLNIGTHDEVY